MLVPKLHENDTQHNFGGAYLCYKERTIRFEFPYSLRSPLRGALVRQKRISLIFPSFHPLQFYQWIFKKIAGYLNWRPRYHFAIFLDVFRASRRWFWCTNFSLSCGSSPSPFGPAPQMTPLFFIEMWFFWNFLKNVWQEMQVLILAGWISNS